MRAIDTNVLARLILQDDVEQARTAEDIVRQPFWITLTVWLELGWVLNKRLRLDRDIVSAALETVIDMDTAHGSDPDGMRWAISRFREGADWADMIHILASRRVADRFATFDAGIAAKIGPDFPFRVETLR